jgi:hypothetical protein
MLTTPETLVANLQRELTAAAEVIAAVNAVLAELPTMRITVTEKDEQST